MSANTETARETAAAEAAANAAEDEHGRMVKAFKSLPFQGSRFCSRCGVRAYCCGKQRRSMRCVECFGKRWRG